MVAEYAPQQVEPSVHHAASFTGVKAGDESVPVGRGRHVVHLVVTDRVRHLSDSDYGRSELRRFGVTLPPRRPGINTRVGFQGCQLAKPSGPTLGLHDGLNVIFDGVQIPQASGISKPKVFY